MLSKAVYGVLLLMIVVKGEEPHCSKFDFEEKMLDKMVRMEFKMEKMKLEMQKSVVAVHETNTRIVNNIEVVTKNQEKLDEQMGQLQTFKDTVNDEVKNKLRSEMINLKDVLRKATVAFKARSNANINVKSGQTFVFPVTILNLGNGYDNTSGVFTAPVNGTYVFTTAFCVKSGDYLSVAIMVDGNQQSGTQYYGDGGHGCHSADTNAVLTAGQKIWVQQIYGNNSNGEIIYHSADYRWNTFSGTLVNS